ncbi:Ribulose-phosphate 3-epimerase [Gonapodya prolifera JEL478]|uniref:Ribulose-phosphate 3-epimerase n=1 Tax=Gonapodya prolifera (strain JEL478) TaxID=1344416 RepID=A0A139A7Z4_GONPJ|nr:Ribulose-phosphate 3-epimerase [Gonapodya prolifera JEL478]|eukprot:KXS12931.1 Ribulose-phosphate 3-epimerase [Gonapodya prolifera JEL478]
MPSPIICPSMLSSDFANLAAEAKRMKDLGADYLHMDVMDGHFVPNLTLGAPIIKSLRKHTDAFLDCHLMVSDPGKWVPDFHSAGASSITFHIEVCPTPAAAISLIQQVHSHGMKCGVSVKPGTPVDALPDEVLRDVDMVLVMTVEPGFGGQKFMEGPLDKVRSLRKRFPNLDIQVDGGLALDTIDRAAEAGANVIVAGTSVFGAQDPKAVMESFRESIRKHSSKW